MTFVKIGAAAAVLCLSLALPIAAEARPLGTVDWMPFFGLPYPFGYVYHPPRMECYDVQEEFDLIEGYKKVVIWTCGGHPPVRAKY